MGVNVFKVEGLGLKLRMKVLGGGFRARGSELHLLTKSTFCPAFVLQTKPTTVKQLFFVSSYGRFREDLEEAAGEGPKGT